jgi:hypothetical protein
VNTTLSVFRITLNRWVVANFASAIAIELRRGSLPDNRDFLRFKFKNGTDDSFRTVHVFGHKGDIPLTEFIYRVEVFVCFTRRHNHVTQTAIFPQRAAIGSNTEWMKVCGASAASNPKPWGMPAIPLLHGSDSRSSFATGMCGALFAALFMLGVLAVSKYYKRSRRGRIALPTNGVSTSLPLQWPNSWLIGIKEERSFVLPTAEKRPVVF